MFLQKHGMYCTYQHTMHMHVHLDTHTPLTYHAQNDRVVFQTHSFNFHQAGERKTLKKETLKKLVTDVHVRRLVSRCDNEGAPHVDRGSQLSETQLQTKVIAPHTRPHVRKDCLKRTPV